MMSEQSVSSSIWSRGGFSRRGNLWVKNGKLRLSTQSQSIRYWSKNRIHPKEKNVDAK